MARLRELDALPSLVEAHLRDLLLPYFVGGGPCCASMRPGLPRSYFWTAKTLLSEDVSLWAVMRRYTLSCWFLWKGRG